MWSEYFRSRARRTVGREQCVLALPEMKDDVGATGFLREDFDCVLSLASTLPAHTVFGGHSGPAGQHRDSVGDDERRVEAHAELPDELGVRGLVSSQPLEKLLGSRLGDGTDVIGHLVARHADPVVAHRDSAGCFVEADADSEVLVVFEQDAVCQRLEP